MKTVQVTRELIFNIQKVVQCDIFELHYKHDDIIEVLDICGRITDKECIYINIEQLKKLYEYILAGAYNSDCGEGLLLQGTRFKILCQLATKLKVVSCSVSFFKFRFVTSHFVDGENISTKIKSIKALRNIARDEELNAKDSYISQLSSGLKECKEMVDNATIYGPIRQDVLPLINRLVNECGAVIEIY
jgi:hypothetical protein